MPTLGSLQKGTYSVPLTRYVKGFWPRDVVWDQIFKKLQVDAAYGSIYEIDNSMLKDYDTNRTLGAPAPQFTFGWKLSPYECQIRALGQEWSMDEGIFVGPTEVPILREMRTATVNKTLVHRAYEIELFGSGGIGIANSSFSDVIPLDWSNPATADPRVDLVNVALDKIERSTYGNVQANTIIMNRATARRIMALPKFAEIYKYTYNALGDVLPPEFFGLRTIYLETRYDSGRKGLASTTTTILEDKAIVCYIADSPESPASDTGITLKEPTWGVTCWVDEMVTTWRDMKSRVDGVDYQMICGPKIIYPECAVRFDITWS